MIIILLFIGITLAYQCSDYEHVHGDMLKERLINDVSSIIEHRDDFIHDQIYEVETFPELSRLILLRKLFNSTDDRIDVCEMIHVHETNEVNEDEMIRHSYNPFVKCPELASDAYSNEC